MLCMVNADIRTIIHLDIPNKVLCLWIDPKPVIHNNQLGRQNEE